MEELIKRITIEYNEHIAACNRLLKQIIELKIRNCMEHAEERRKARIKELEEKVNAQLMEIRAEELKKAEKKAEEAEKSRIKSLMQADAKLQAIIDAENEEWEKEKAMAVAEAEATNINADVNLNVPEAPEEEEPAHEPEQDNQ